MRRPQEIILFMILVASVATAMGASGVSNKIGVSPSTGIQDDVEKANDTLRQKNYEANREKGEVNFIGSVFAAVDKVVESFIMVYQLYHMMVSIGVPPWIATMFSSPMFLIFGSFMLYLISGRQLLAR